jgi:hypothetical protein
MKFGKGMAMMDASKTLVAYAAAIGLSPLVSAPAGAQPRSLAPAVQCDGNVDQTDKRSFVSQRLPAPPISATTRALLPGHWTLQGSNYVWVPAETRLREVQTLALVQGGYVWRNGSYVWVPAYYAKR